MHMAKGVGAAGVQCLQRCAGALGRKRARTSVLLASFLPSKNLTNVSSEPVSPVSFMRGASDVLMASAN